MRKAASRRVGDNKRLSRELTLHEQVVALIVRDNRSFEEISRSMGGRPSRWTLWNWRTNPVNGSTAMLERVARHYGLRLTLRKAR